MILSIQLRTDSGIFSVATILLPAHDHVWIQTMHKEEVLFTDRSDINAFERERERASKRGYEQMYMLCAALR